MAVVGTVVVLLSKSDQAQLESHISANGKVTGITHAQYVSQANNISTRQTVGAVIAGVGVVGAGIGAWLWLTTPDKPGVALTPTWNGIQLTARF